MREFLGLVLPEAPPDHSTISRTRRLIDLETHEAVFTWMLLRLADAGLVKGKTVGIDGTTLEANAALRSIVRRDTGESYQDFVTTIRACLAEAAGGGGAERQVVRPTDMQVYRIMRDVTGEAYTLLLEAALKEASTFSLVWRDQLQFGPSAAAVREALRGLQLRHVKRDRWPGTILVGHYASVVTYRAAPEALPALLEPGSLFAWQSPAYPEDLSFSTEPGAVCLATVSHEAKAWILSPSLAAAIGKRVTLTRETLDARDEQYFNAV